MSRFIPKKTLTEGMASNPLDAVQTVSNDITKKAQEGILTAVAAETDAINQYEQILDLINSSEPWLSEKAIPVIKDIIAEEKKHLGQLTELVSQLPGYQVDFEKGEKETQTGEDTSDKEAEKTEEEKEEVEESVTIETEDGSIEVETIYVNDAVDPETGIECIAAYEDSQACLNQEEPTVYLNIDQFKKLQELVNAGSLKIITRDELLADNSIEEIK